VSVTGGSITSGGDLFYVMARTVTYDASLAANAALGGKTYALANGGTLAPR
jgi:hypothetical protein